MSLLGSLNLFGPIFEKELRISSRQRRNYALRTLYVLVLTLVVVLIWASYTMSVRYNPIYSMARMSQAGVELLCTVGFFQFVALQLIAPVLISTAISDEINHSTLGTLMMTPITSFQIVTGKLFSRLWIMILLLGTSLPILAIIRIFGGIEWQLILSMIALTLCAAVLAAAVSLIYSIFHRKAYAAILMTYMTLLATYLLIPLLISVSLYANPQTSTFAYLNPFMSMTLLMEQAQRPGRGMSPGWLWPPFQCAILLGVTLVLVLICSTIVRRVGLRMAAGEAVVQWGNKPKKNPPDSPASDSRYAARLARAVSNHPVLWRELHLPVLKTRARRIVLVAFTLAALAYTYHRTWSGMNDDDTQMLYTFVFMLATLVTAAILPATTVTAEKEASTWEVLLATPISARDIVWGKTLGSLKKILPVSLLFFGHVLFFTLLGKIHPLALVHMVFLLAGPVFFLVAAGIKISSWVKHTTTAVLLNLGLGIFLWALLPIFTAITTQALRFAGWDNSFLDAVLLPNPFFLDLACFDALTGAAPPLKFHFPTHSFGDAMAFTSILCAISLCYALAGIVALESAIRRLRHQR